ncbi:hypothetical protein [Nannocystis pusilla]|uniref:hypothetical protein n=1 Tax=Nannocystis pusilla TaxID=889268 RepID=UPI003B7A67DC
MRVRQHLVAITGLRPRSLLASSPCRTLPTVTAISSWGRWPARPRWPLAPQRALYDAGGREVLPTVAQAGLQTVLTRTATGTVAAAAPTLLVDAAVQAGAAEVTSLAVVTTARAAGPRSRAPPRERVWSASSSTPPSAPPRA